MKKITFLFLMIFTSLNIYAQTYTISFAATGAATTVDSVKVENITQGTTVKWHAGDVLQLILSNGINNLGINEENFHIFPNPMQGQAEILFYVKQSGNATLSIYSISGKEIMLVNNKFSQGIQKFQLKGLKQGVYFINICGENYLYTSKLISLSTMQCEVKIVNLNLGDSKVENNDQHLKSTNTIVDMPYTSGDRLLFKGISGNYSNIITDIPTASKTITFNFTACSDIDNNIYATVQIGSQTWMAENLKTTKYTNGISIPIITDNTAWATLTTGAYCNYNNDTNNAATYGRLYNWYAVTDSRNLCPPGWHSPSDTEFTMLTSYLGGEFIAGEKLKETTTLHWQSPNSGATNESGFTALPAGGRNNDGIFPSNDIGYRGNWWSTTQNNTTTAWYRGIENINGSVMRNFYYNTTGFSVRCVKGGNLATITTSSVTGITIVSAVSGGNITSDGGSSVTTRGVCWSLNSNPSLANSFSSDGSGIGNFTSNITGLMPNTTYFVRAYATNNIGTSYGSEVFFTTLSSNYPVVDFDGNGYDTVHIGSQIWMKQNLKTTHFCNGDSIPNISIISSWTSLSIGAAYCNYNNDVNYVATYGRLYNFNTVTDTRNLCPIGWHIPLDAEITALTNYLGGESIAGGKLKEIDTTHWHNPNTGASNETGFTALPGGTRSGQYGTFSLNGTYLFFWSSTASDTYNAWCRSIANTNTIVSRGTTAKRSGLSVRCIKN